MLQQAFANGSSKNDENVTFLKKKCQIGDKTILNLISRKY